MRIIQWISSTWVWSSSRWIRRYVWRLHSEVNPQNWNVKHNDYDMADPQKCKHSKPKNDDDHDVGVPQNFNALDSLCLFLCNFNALLSKLWHSETFSTQIKLNINFTIPLHFCSGSFSIPIKPQTNNKLTSKYNFIVLLSNSSY